MDLSSISALGRPSTIDDGNNSAFREADFLAIMLAEITNQDPFEPTETSKSLRTPRSSKSWPIHNTASSVMMCVGPRTCWAKRLPLSK